VRFLLIQQGLFGLYMGCSFAPIVPSPPDAWSSVSVGVRPRRPVSGDLPAKHDELVTHTRISASTERSETPGQPGGTRRVRRFPCCAVGLDYPFLAERVPPSYR
jgi:hypothetical protein